MQLRQVTSYEQPHVLHRGLHEAVVIRGDTSQPVRVVMATLEMLGVLYVLRTLGLLPARGVPHGVTHAIVHARKVQFELGSTEPMIRFCPSHSYQVESQSLAGADGGAYPPMDQTYVSAGCTLPDRDCYCDARLRVSINGSIQVHIEELQPTDAVAA